MTTTFEIGIARVDDLIRALLAEPMRLNAVVDEYLALQTEDPATIWKAAPEHAHYLANVILSLRAHEALEQALIPRIRDRLHSLGRQDELS